MKDTCKSPVSNRRTSQQLDLPPLYVLLAGFMFTFFLLFMSMNEYVKSDRSGFGAILELFPLHFFWFSVGKGNPYDLCFLEPPFENEWRKQFRENNNPHSPPKGSQFTLRCRFIWKDRKNQNVHFGQCYMISHRMTTDREVVAWCGLFSTAKLKGTCYTPTTPHFLCAMSILPIILFLALICALYKCTYRDLRKNVRKTKRHKNKIRKAKLFEIDSNSCNRNK